MTLKTLPFDPARYLDNNETIAVFMEEAFKTNDTIDIADALSIAARAKGMTLIAEQAGLKRHQLFDAFDEGAKPSRRVLHALKKAFGIEAISKKKAA